MKKHPQLKFIVRNSIDGTIQLASQPALKKIKLITCKNCNKIQPVQ